MKKTLLVFILIFSLSFFYGCQKQEISISRDFILLSLDLSKSVVTESVRVGVNSQKISSLSSSKQEELEFKRNLIDEVENIRLEFLFSLALVYSTNPIEEFKINQGAILSQVFYNERGDFVGFDVTFTSLSAWQYYHKNEGSGQNQNQGNIFYLKKESKGVFPFSLKAEEQTIGQKYKNHYLSAAKGLSFYSQLFEDYHPQFVYNYSTLYKQIKSNAKASYFASDGKYHHVWVVNEEKLGKNNTILLYFTEIYKGWWIFFGTLLPLLAGGVAIIIIKIKRNKKLGSKA